jgi:hypothetical protein
MHDGLIIFTCMDSNVKTLLTLCTMGPLCHTRPFFPSSCSMLLLTPSLLAVDCLSCSPDGGPGPLSPPTPLRLTPFPLGPRQHSTLLSGTLPLPGPGEMASWRPPPVFASNFRGRPLPLPSAWPVSCISSAVSRFVILKLSRGVS